MWVLGSMFRTQHTMNEIHAAMNPVHISRLPGAGNKIINLIDQKSDLYVNMVPNFKHWDLCAGEALIQSMMGIVCDADNKPLIYNANSTDFTITEGIVIAKNLKVFNTMHERI